MIYLNIVDVVAVPGGVEEFVAKAHDKDVLDHLLTQVVVNTEDLLLLPIGLEGFLQLARTGQVLAKRLLDLDGQTGLVGRLKSEQFSRHSR